MSKIDNFAYPTPIPAEICGCFLWSRSVMSECAEKGEVRLISHWSYFPRIPTYMTTIPQPRRQTDRRTDRQTDRQLGLATQLYAMLRVVKQDSRHNGIHNAVVMRSVVRIKSYISVRHPAASDSSEAINTHSMRRFRSACNEASNLRGNEVKVAITGRNNITIASTTTFSFVDIN